MPSEALKKAGGFAACFVAVAAVFGAAIFALEAARPVFPVVLGAWAADWFGGIAAVLFFVLAGFPLAALKAWKDRRF